jgi:hypothetical protein
MPREFDFPSFYGQVLNRVDHGYPLRLRSHRMARAGRYALSRA